MSHLRGPCRRPQDGHPNLGHCRGREVLLAQPNLHPKLIRRHLRCGCSKRRSFDSGLRHYRWRDGSCRHRQGQVRLRRVQRAAERSFEEWAQSQRLHLFPRLQRPAGDSTPHLIALQRQCSDRRRCNQQKQLALPIRGPRAVVEDPATKRLILSIPRLRGIRSKLWTVVLWDAEAC
jgi:hypothetical protein